MTVDPAYYTPATQSWYDPSESPPDDHFVTRYSECWCCGKVVSEEFVYYRVTMPFHCTECDVKWLVKKDGAGDLTDKMIEMQSRCRGDL